MEGFSHDFCEIDPKSWSLLFISQYMGGKIPLSLKLLIFLLHTCFRMIISVDIEDLRPLSWRYLEELRKLCREIKEVSRNFHKFYK
jgi:hypothetical protein